VTLKVDMLKSQTNLIFIYFIHRKTKEKKSKTISHCISKKSPHTHTKQQYEGAYGVCVSKWEDLDLAVSTEFGI
jgi:hypothetical protein